jgi:hypothetical protein
MQFSTLWHARPSELDHTGSHTAQRAVCDPRSHTYCVRACARARARACVRVISEAHRRCRHPRYAHTHSTQHTRTHTLACSLARSPTLTRCRKQGPLLWWQQRACGGASGAHCPHRAKPGLGEGRPSGGRALHRMPATGLALPPPVDPRHRLLSLRIINIYIYIYIYIYIRILYLRIV